MEPERWQQVSQLFQSALERDPRERAPYLREACGGDPSLRRQIESLLAAHEKAESDGFIGTPAVEHAAPLLAEEEVVTGASVGRYKILKLLGAGGMGEVYLATDTTLERPVALKVLPAEIAHDKDRVHRFIHEAKAASALNHPNILTVYEVGDFQSSRFIVTEFIKGKTLRERIVGEPITLHETLDVALQVAAALSAAHEAGIIHRDIKPENIMLRDDGLVKVLDFGLAKLTEKRNEAPDPEAETLALVRTTPGMIMGTAAYMSPEQARGKATDARTDIFSFGVVLYEMLAGRQPFAGETVSDTMAAILKGEPAPLSCHVPDIPKELERIVGRTLRKDADERYQHVRDLLIDLSDLKQDLEFEAKLEGHAGPSWRAGAATGGGKTPTARTNAAGVETAPAGRTTLSVEYIVSSVSQHKRGALVALAAILLLSIAGIASYFYLARRGQTIDSIAVLPFANTSNDPNVEYLSDGISEALINNLTELRQLRVIARTTAFRYKGKEIDPQAVGRELNVRAVLTGRVRQTGDMLDIQVDLVDSSTGAQLWGEGYQRRVSDVLSLKQTIARAATEKLKLRLSGEEQQKLVRHDTANAEAYQFYLRGRYFWNKRTEDGIKKAMEQFQQAIDRDPTYALGYVGLADSYIFLHEHTYVSDSDLLTKARAAAERALQLDDSLAEAHASLAFIYRHQWRWAEAEEEFKRAVSLNPNYSNARIWFSVYYRNKRQFDDALGEIKRAQELDPLSPVIGANVAYVHVLKNDLDSAVEQCKRTLELDPNNALIHELLGIAYLKQQRHEEATAELQKAVELSGRASGRYLSSLGYCYAVTGRRDEALAIVKDLEGRYTKGEASGQNVAGVYAGLGDRDQALAWLERTFEQRGTLLPEINWRFAFDGLRDNRRFADLVRRMGLEP